MKFKLPSTFSVLATLSIAAAAWEAYTLVDKERGNTFSATIRKLSDEQPFIVLVAGLVCGHLFRENTATLLTGIGVGMSHWPLIDKEDLEAIH